MMGSARASLRGEFMKDGLDHLPAAKRREIRKVLDVLFGEMENENRLKTQEWKRRRRILKVILLGGHARGDWVRGHQISGYRSDYDILIVVSHPGLVVDRNFVYRTRDHFAPQSPGGRIRALGFGLTGRRAVALASGLKSPSVKIQ